MSISYYELELPITNIHVDKFNGHAHVGIWVNHKKAGTLIMEPKEWDKMSDLFQSNYKVAYTYWGGENLGMMLFVYREGFEDEQIINEYGEITTLRQLRERVAATTGKAGLEERR